MVLMNMYLHFCKTVNKQAKCLCFLTVESIRNATDKRNHNYNRNFSNSNDTQPYSESP